MEFKELIIASAEKPVFQVKQERYEEECDDSNFELKTINDPTAFIVEEEVCENYLSDIVKEEYVVSYSDNSCGNSIEFQHEFQSTDPLGSLNGAENVECPLMDNDQIFECFSCRLTFKTEVQLKKHLDRKCFRRFECEICRRRFKCNAYLMTHKQTHFPKNNFIKEEKKIQGIPTISFICSEPGCNKQFSRKDRLIVHLRIHNGDRPYQCDEDGCDKKFTEWSNLEKHRRIHVGDKRFTCDSPGCDKKFTAKCNLIDHKKTHTGENSKKNTKTFVCEICDKTIAHSSSFRKHLKIHSGEKPYVCDYEGCDKRFLRRYRLKEHSNIHTGAKPYICTNAHCNKRFNDKNSLNSC